MRFLFALFVLIPLVEMLVLFEVSDHIGAWNTLFLVVLTAVIGIQILRRQGISTLTRANQRLRGGELPAQEILEGIFLAVGGAFLLTPGFITDTLGFLLLIGPSRRFLARKVLTSGRFSIYTAGGEFHRSGSYSSPDFRGEVYEGEFHQEKGSRPGLDDLKD